MIHDSEKLNYFHNWNIQIFNSGFNTICQLYLLRIYPLYECCNSGKVLMNIIDKAYVYSVTVFRKKLECVLFLF